MFFNTLLLPPLCSYFSRLMALPTLSHFQTPFLNPRPSPSPSQNPNPFSISFLSSARSHVPPTSLRFRCSPPPFPIRCSADNYGDYNQERVLHPRPQEIQWSKELANSVRLIGIVGSPVQIKHLTSGKTLAWTRIGVWKSSTETSWVNLTFWDELAHVAFQHVEKGQQVFVSGRLVSDVVEGDDEKQTVYYKVVVQQLNFVERSFPQVSLYESETNSAASGEKHGNFVSNSSGSTEELWQAFFANPVDWWDNRKNKRNPKYPDFKHKHTGEALWLEGKYNPPWVKSQLAILDSRMSTLQANEPNPAVSFMYADEFTTF
ncbi:protein OSB1, mitochondrial-like [Typha latifolia]|uniref:protein OSB1, mitochondrial-like n=1 Tax=Typha latifolia TaxID=4733 RepID=UPI003C2FF937